MTAEGFTDHNTEIQTVDCNRIQLNKPANENNSLINSVTIKQPPKPWPFRV